MRQLSSLNCLRSCFEERIDRLRAREHVALRVVHADPAQVLQLRFGFRLLGHRALAEHVRDLGYRAHHRFRQAAAAVVDIVEVADEAAVDLQVVDVEVAQVAERTEAGAEIVQREAATEVAHAADEAARAGHVADHAGLGDLQAQLLRAQRAAAQAGGEVVAPEECSRACSSAAFALIRAC